MELLLLLAVKSVNQLQLLLHLVILLNNIKQQLQRNLLLDRYTIKHYATYQIEIMQAFHRI